LASPTQTAIASAWTMVSGEKPCWFEMTITAPSPSTALTDRSSPATSSTSIWPTATMPSTADWIATVVRLPGS
jgi:hypothetical protein